MAATHPDRVDGVVAINPGLNLTPPHAHRAPGWTSTTSLRATRDGRWRTATTGCATGRRYTEFFFDELLPEPHSTKQHEDCVGMVAASTTAGDNARRAGAQPSSSRDADPDTAEDVCRRVRCPVLVINGDQDMCQPPERSHRVAELTGGELLVLEGAGHLPHARDPVKVNLEIDRFVRRIAGR